MFKRKQYQMGSSAYTEAAKTNPTEKQPIQTGGNAGVGSLLGEMASSFVNSQAGKDILQGFSVAAGGPTNEQVDTFAYKVNENKKARDKGMDEPFPTPASDLTGIGGEGQTGPTAMQRWAERTRQPTQSVAMALQRMSSGVGAHPGGAGRGKGAGGSLGQEARQAMKRKRLSKRIANRKAKEDNDYAEGGKVEGKELDMQMSAMMKGPTHTMPDGTVHPGATHEEYEQMLAEGQAEDMAQEGMVPDEQMEEDFVDYVVESTLEPEDTMYLEEALAADPRLSEIFDQVIETASEFSGSGPVEGPGSEVSDSIPARLSDGEFVITAKATEEIGPDNLQGMMEQAEMDADVRRAEAEGGYIDDDEDMAMINPMQRTVDPTEREMRKLQLAANPRTQYRTVYG